MFDFLSAEAACLVERMPDTNKDIWRQTAAEMFGIPYDKVTSEQRAIAKAVEWPTAYTIGIGDKYEKK